MQNNPHTTPEKAKLTRKEQAAIEATLSSHRKA